MKPNVKISRKILMILFDLSCYAITAGAYVLLAFCMEEIKTEELLGFAFNCGILYASMLLFRGLLKTYLGVWRYAGTGVYARMLIADACGGVLALVITLVTGLYRSFWDLLVVCSISVLIALGSRFAYRLIYKRRHQSVGDEGHRIEVAIVGAGQIGVLLANDLLCTVSTVVSLIRYREKK
jgi:FlaA1/EpsC-like NDP-sugar epimerase